MAKKLNEEDHDMLAQLGFDLDAEPPTKTVAQAFDETRATGGVREIEEFRAQHGRMPDSRQDISEYILAARLDKFRKSEESDILPETAGNQEIPSGKSVLSTGDEWIDKLDDDALLAELGIEESPITTLKFVRSAAERKAAAERKSADYIAQRDQCHDFSEFKPLFEKIQREIKAKTRGTRLFRGNPQIEKGRYFILNGQIAYVASKDGTFTDNHGFRDARLRVIFDNGTESDLLMRSLQKALLADKAGRRITESDISALPMFAQQEDNDDGGETSGRIYVLRSNSDNPYIVENRDFIHKIGVTGGSVEKRIANAVNDPTFLMADVEIVNTYRLLTTGHREINRVKLENMIHRIFGSAQCDMAISDRFGGSVRPQEWFLAPYSVIDEAIRRIGHAIENGRMIDFTYDRETCQLQNDNPEPDDCPEIDDCPKPDNCPELDF